MAPLHSFRSCHTYSCVALDFGTHLSLAGEIIKMFVPNADMAGTIKGQ